MISSEVHQAFSEAIECEFISIPDEDEIEYVFSKRFEKKMKKLIRRINHKSPRYSKKKIVLTVVAAIILSIMLMMSVSAIREPVVKYIISMYDSFMEITYEGDLSLKINRELTLGGLSDDFVETERKRNDAVLSVRYRSKSSGDEIWFYQTITDGANPSIDNKNGIISEIEVNGLSVILYESKSADYFMADWVQDTYSVALTYYGKIDKEEFIELVGSVK